MVIIASLVVLCVLSDCQSPCPDELGGVPHVAIVPIKALNSSQKEIIAGEERPKYFAANKLDNSQGGFYWISEWCCFGNSVIIPSP